MRLYKIIATNTNGEDLPDREIHWVGSKAEGVQARKKLYDEGWRRKDVEETEVDVPTDKAGLLEFLNKQ
jgi:hypothetical protein